MSTTAYLDYVDYIIFVLTLSMSAAIGIYFGCFGSSQSAKEYLYGTGRKQILPIGLSIFSSATSALPIIGIPAEIYAFGAQYMLTSIGFLLSLVIIWTFVIPVFCGNINIKTPYEYFELRYNSKVRMLSSLIYLIFTYIFMPIALYSATVAFSEMTNIPVDICVITTGVICTIYTMLGGFAAVIWSDSLQATLMLFSCMFVLMKSVINLGGFSVVWQRAEEGQRLNFFIMDPNPFRRMTFWSVIFGITFMHAGHFGCGATALQKFMALKNEKQAKLSTIIGTACLIFSGLLLSFLGLTMYAYYYNCDPLQNKEISNFSKLTAYFIASVIGNVPGFLGLFNAGLLSAGLSTLSAELNTSSGIIYHDFIKKYFKNISDKTGVTIMKIIVLINGIIFIILATQFDKIKYLYVLALGFGGMINACKAAMIILGTTFPKSNSTGIIVGTITGLISVGWIQYNTLFYDVSSADLLPLSTEGCNSNITNVFNETISISKTVEPPLIYKLSFMYYGVLNILIIIPVALFVSYITGGNNFPEKDPNLFIPAVRPKDKQKTCETTNILLKENFVDT